MNNWRKGITIVAVFILAPFWLLKAQSSYRADSLQFKMYTRLFVSDQVQLDSVVVKKVFCDYCSERQIEVLKKEAYRQSVLESENPKYKKPGQHRLALYVRLSKEDFRALNNRDE